MTDNHIRHPLSPYIRPLYPYTTLWHYAHLVVFFPTLVFPMTIWLFIILLITKALWMVNMTWDMSVNVGYNIKPKCLTCCTTRITSVMNYSLKTSCYSIIIQQMLTFLSNYNERQHWMQSKLYSQLSHIESVTWLNIHKYLCRMLFVLSLPTRYVLLRTIHVRQW